MIRAVLACLTLTLSACGMRLRTVKVALPLVGGPELIFERQTQPEQR
jgi:hypothetical protein